MPLKTHHKWMIGTFGTIIVIYMIVSAVFMYSLFVKQNIDNKDLNQKIISTQSDINTLTDNLIQTKETLQQTLSGLDLKVGSIGQEMDLLRASAGEDFSGVIEKAVKSVVTIRTNVGQGTGFIINDQGYLVTNAHVLAGGQKVQAITYDQETLEVEFIGYDGTFDIALLKIAKVPGYIALGDSDKIQVGENVIAIGNPLGLQFSVSQGIVSGVHRPGPRGVEAYIQTDAALNPGNSGGPLINKQGEVIGINNFKIGAGESLGFALESNYIRDAVNAISLKAKNENLI